MNEDLKVVQMEQDDANEDLAYCRECGVDINLDGGEEYRDYIQLDDEEFLCDDCACRCHRCGFLILPDEEREAQSGNVYCDHCADRVLTRCLSCGELVENDEVVEVFRLDGSIRVCESCIEDNPHYYLSCPVCRRYWVAACMYNCWVENEEEYMELCPDCAEAYPSDPPPRIILSYDWRPYEWEFFVSKGESLQETTFYGVELEIDGGGENHTNANLLVDTISNQKGGWYAKHDGSLSSGFELVSMPSSLRYHLEGAKAFACFAKEATKLGYRSHDAGTCGLHIHVSRIALGGTEAEREATIGKILLWMDWCWEKFVKFSRRTQQQLDRWAARYCCIEARDEPEVAYRKACDTCDRYVCLNLRNEDTIEFRMFRGTLLPETYYATLEFVDATVKFCRDTNIDELFGTAWNVFVVRFCNRYKYLPNYLEKRGLA